MSISSAIKSIQKIMRKDVGVDGDAQRIGQLVWMLFLKILDDREAEWELLEDDYKSPLPQRLRWRNWAADPEAITGDELKEFIDNDLFPSLRELAPRHNRALGHVIRDVFQDTYNYMKSGQLLRQVINKIQAGVDFNKVQERHAFGDMYEQLLRELQSAGNAGEFYTPRSVTEFMVERVDPKLHERVLDPACGTGGFLTCTIEHKRKRYVHTSEDEQILQASIFGVEKKPLPHLLATTNMVLHGIAVPSQIKHDNTLSRPLTSWGPEERVDCIVANPPFGGMEEDGIENNFPAAFRTRETADLFLVLIMHLLKTDGRAAVVLPDGFLFGEGIKSRIKEKLLTECNLHTIVRLPKQVFSPYTDISTNLLFFTKGTPTKEVWFYEHQYPAGYKSYSKTKPMRVEEFAAEQAWWGSEDEGFSAREENAFAWKVSVDELKARNWNLDCKNPHVGEQEVHDPEVLLRNYASLQDEISALCEQLKTLLAEALEKGKSSQVTENLQLLVSAPEGIKKIRSLILELAVRGKLVPQDPNDEPANELLRRIAENEVRLIALGKKKRKSTYIDRSMGVSFEVPAGWAITTLGDVVEIVRGITFPAGEKSKVYGAGRVACLRTANVQDEIEWGDLLYISERYVSRDDQYLMPHDIVMSMANSRELVGKVALVGAELEQTTTFGGFLGVLRPRMIEPRFVMALLRAPSTREELINSASQTTNIANISLGKLMPFPFAVPPLAEQRRIVVKVDELMALCDELKAQLNAARQLHEKLAGALVEQAVA